MEKNYLNLEIILCKELSNQDAICNGFHSRMIKKALEGKIYNVQLSNVLLWEIITAGILLL
jgi:hypothetical protein